MTTPIKSACQQRGCLRFHAVKNDYGAIIYTCEAFPRGIPHAIVTGINKHLSPVEGDDGLTYLPPPGGDPTQRR